MIAQPLYALTRKDVPFHWTAACDSAFDYLKTCLTTAPILSYLDFDKSFVLETDASILGLRAILSQKQEDEKYTQWLMQVILFQSMRKITQLLIWRCLQLFGE